MVAKKMTNILIIEDDPFYSRLIAELLEDHNIGVTCIQSAEEALAVDAEEYCAAIIDVMLPNNPTVSGISVEESRGGFNTGIGVAKRLLQKNANMRVVLLSSAVFGRDVDAWATNRSIPFVHKEQGMKSLLRELRRQGCLPRRAPLAFIVHGHDEIALLELKNYIQNTLKWQEPIVLREQTSSGKTTIERFEDYAHRVDCVFVLLTPDDMTTSSDSNDEKRRSRQNVVFELGFFYGSLERKAGRVLLLHKGAVELPSDVSGIVWIDITSGIEAAGEAIRKEVATLTQGG
jgi:predicted nucleotide-binding protein